MKVCIVGAGLAGTLTAALLSKLGFKVYIYEKRPDPRVQDEELLTSEFGASTSATKRSINLALSHRGMEALKELGVLEAAMEKSIRMPCRVIHGTNGEQTTQAYGKSDQAIYSVGRQHINLVLLEFLSRSNSNVEIAFSTTLVDVDSDGTVVLKDVNDVTFSVQFDLVLGADGAYSKVRSSILRKSRTNFDRYFIDHGYKELTIPPNKDNEYALSHVEGLHIWPRGKFMLIALPNPDKSFTATLFAPYKGKDGFDSIDPNSAEDVENYFARHFPDVVPLMPSLCEDYKQNPVGSLITVRTDPWNYGKVLLIGDAAHAVVPFYGQGMNAAFQDGLMLYRLLKKKLKNKKMSEMNLSQDIEEFSKLRQPAANALADLCLEHYHDMAANTASSFYLIQKKVESVINWMFPQFFVPLYTLVAFTETPYHEAVEIANTQDQWMRMITLTGLGSLGVFTAFGLFLLKTRNLK